MRTPEEIIKYQAQKIKALKSNLKGVGKARAMWEARSQRNTDYHIQYFKLYQEKCKEIDNFKATYRLSKFFWGNLEILLIVGGFIMGKYLK